MNNRPGNWYQMDYDQQKEWERNQRAIEDAEYEMRQAQEQAQDEINSVRRSFHREQEEMRGEYQQLSYDFDTVSKQNKMLRDALQRMVNLFPPDEDMINFDAPVRWNREPIEAVKSARKLLQGKCPDDDYREDRPGGDE